MNIFTDWLTTFGDNGVLVASALFGVLILTGVGVPVTEEIITVFAGWLIYHGTLDPITAWLVCYVGVVIADAMTFYIGWHFGKALLHRRWVKRLLHPKRVLWAHHQVREHGAWMIVASRFIPGMRYATVLISGMMRLERWKYFTAEMSSAAVTVALHLGIGYWLGRMTLDFDEAMKKEGPFALALAGVGVLLILGYFGVRRMRRTGRLPQRPRRRDIMP
jgi:membrane-associated protein